MDTGSELQPGGGREPVVVVVEDDLDSVSQVEVRALLLDYFHGHDSVASDLRLAFGCSGAFPDDGTAGHRGGE